MFIVGDNDNEDFDTKAKIILIDQKYKSDRFTDNIIGQVKNVGNGTAKDVNVIFIMIHMAMR